MVRIALVVIFVLPLLIGCQTSHSAKSTVYLIKIEKGDTLSKIASKYDTTWRRIVNLNKLKSGRSISIGQILRVRPGPGGLVAGARRARLPMKPAMSDESFQEQELDGSAATGQKRQGLFFGGKEEASIVWPISGRISSRYGRRWGRMHHGIDITSPEGKRIHAAGKGIVSFVGYKKGYGRTVIIKHKRHQTLYAHMSRILVNHGDYVDQGQTVGKVGQTGNAKGAHLHFEIRDLSNKTLDPMKHLPKKRLLVSRK